MKTVVILMLPILTIAALLPSRGVAEDNPFFAPYGTPWEVPAFDKIKTEHFMPAFERGIAEQKKEMEGIRDSKDAATFTNTIEAMEVSGKLLTRVSDVFFNLNSAETSDEMQAVAKDVAPKLSALNDDIYLDPKLFARVKTIYVTRDKLKLTPEQTRLLKETY